MKATYEASVLDPSLLEYYFSMHKVKVKLTFKGDMDIWKRSGDYLKRNLNIPNSCRFMLNFVHQSIFRIKTIVGKM